ncbi:hypothetical protein [Microbacterium saperdae]|uniref:Uncharacterized protein n=1 Tax=Microbacterium saperdae TaxID=69368 RepID=A0A543BL48_9MICO|nr:hypothetical protein [Microbacterium saperdae]TQL85534.1 hypothetical protein FB560_1151 [Microbacterium saperdae]GGM63049.1 hypothetical protein GCM10010489_38180 [Microbacterium saperdae]
MGKKRTQGFWSGEVWGRRKQLLKDPALWVSLVLACVTGLIAPFIPLGALYVQDLANYALLYAALSFGAAIAGAGIALGVPGDKRVRRWSNLKPQGSRYSAFQNLLFTFAWSAMIQIGLVLVSFLAIAFGTGFAVIPLGVAFSDAWFHYFVVYLAFWLWWYALFELSAVVRIFMQVAGAIVKENVLNVDEGGKEESATGGGPEAKKSLILPHD